ncbi:hypothetical protein SAMN05660895_0886 [Thermoflavifilum thermophilum]|uniref:Uncharacterized protein n=1 Tax=Thermoflavifilum thermophilum TaxID=1393122 RepID=A0A1I7N7V3_9BACT|nr:hypothetical protein SAMN05660895_0886 [Thermoflavifilum thermophilum]
MTEILFFADLFEMTLFIQPPHAFEGLTETETQARLKPWDRNTFQTR